MPIEQKITSKTEKRLRKELDELIAEYREKARSNPVDVYATRDMLARLSIVVNRIKEIRLTRTINAVWDGQETLKEILYGSRGNP